MIGSLFLKASIFMLFIAFMGYLRRRGGPNRPRDDSAAEKGLSQEPAYLETERSDTDNQRPIDKPKAQPVAPQVLQEAQAPAGTNPATKEQPVDQQTTPTNQPEQEPTSCSTSTPPKAPPAPVPKPPSRKAAPYQAVRVLFLTWENERHLSTSCNALMNELRRILGLIYHFTIQEFSIPTTGPESNQPDATLLKYLLQRNLLVTSLPDTDTDHDDDATEPNELLIVIYSGQGSLINGRFHLTTKIETPRGHRNDRTTHDDPTLPRGWRKMAWEWFESRIASARYDSLCVLNATYVPVTPLTPQPVRGANMVLAGAGPETDFRKQILADMMKEKQDDEKDKDLGYVVPWSTGFLKMIFEMLEERAADGNLKVSLDELFKRLVLEHDRLHVPSSTSTSRPPDRAREEIKRPYLGHIKGMDGEHEDRVIEIWLERQSGSSSGNGKSVAPEPLEGEWTIC